MNYDPIKGVIQITPKEAKSGAMHLLYAIKNIKKAANLPLTPYKNEGGGLLPADIAMKGVIDAAEKMGIDLGARWGNEIDSTNAG